VVEGFRKCDLTRHCLSSYHMITGAAVNACRNGRRFAHDRELLRQSPGEALSHPIDGHGADATAASFPLNTAWTGWFLIALYVDGAERRDESAAQEANPRRCDGFCPVGDGHRRGVGGCRW
jgi:hypothetical protein